MMTQSISKHKSIASLALYKRASIKKKVEMASQLNNVIGIKSSTEPTLQPCCSSTLAFNHELSTSNVESTCFSDDINFNMEDIFTDNDDFFKSLENLECLQEKQQISAERPVMNFSHCTFNINIQK